MRSLVYSLAVCALVASTPQARALTFNISTIGNETPNSSQLAAINTAAQAWSSIVSTDITVNLQIGFTSLGSNILGQTSANFQTVSAAALRLQFAQQVSSGDDVLALASLATAAPSLSITTAQAKALGFGASGVDGTITFSTDFPFATTRDADGTLNSPADAGRYDLVSVATHEIGHVLGFISAVDGGLGYPTLLDEYRYASAGSRSFRAGQAAYFSLDGGITEINGFAVGGSGNDQASHWLTGTNALMDPSLPPQTIRTITALDRRAYDVLGYTLVTVPEPGALALLAPCLLACVAVRRRSYSAR